ncbi:condensation domain-containing protein [Flavobacterium selenitireducens]|uniref:condensation domain-containing protein n=1 Tax=Flavobacterium selenitireducens TaxID=2722704 RepID=UPI00168A9DED|nr:condensation domain-containing protein [Flavobacterium selenitireducens]MBD3583562.1 condensation protein [Flavobacterium selenitireducens]
MKQQNRRLGAFEKTFWLLDLIDSKDFALAGEIEGRKAISEWESALEKVQRRHPNLSVRITSDASAGTVLEHVESTPIPLRVVDVPDDYRWEAEVEKELAIRFDTSKSPLIRAVLVQKPQHTVLILVGHHAIADGTSINYLFRDILNAITGIDLPLMQPQKSNDETLGFAEYDGVGDPSDLHLKADDNKTFAPKIASLRLSPSLTKSIIDKSRQEKTTVHAAICAAVLIASRKMRADWTDKKIELISPICSRRALGLDDNYGLNITTHPVHFEGEQHLPFWDIARLAKAGLAGTDTAEHVQNYIGFFRDLTFKTPDLREVVEILKQAFNQEIMVTNLGRVKYDTDFGALRLNALYGPMVRSGKGKEQTVGVITSNGSLCLTNTSDTPIDGLLQAMEKLLSDACEATS